MKKMTLSSSAQAVQMLFDKDGYTNVRSQPKYYQAIAHSTAQTNSAPFVAFMLDVIISIRPNITQYSAPVPSTVQSSALNQ